MSDFFVPLMLLSTKRSSPAGFRYRVINDMTITAAMVPKQKIPVHMNNIGFLDDVRLEKKDNSREK